MCEGQSYLLIGSISFFSPFPGLSSVTVVAMVLWNYLRAQGGRKGTKTMPGSDVSDGGEGVQELPGEVSSSHSGVFGGRSQE